MSHSPEPTAAPPGRILELDALRGLAALAVVTLHYTSDYDRIFGHTDRLLAYNPLGKYGVELFFMLSGFVMLMSLQRAPRASEFAVSRFARLYPAYWCGILLTFGIVTLAQLPGRTVSLSEAFGNLSMLHLNTRDVDPVYWTLKCELQFYTLMVVLLACRLTKHASSVLAGLVLVHIADVFWNFTEWDGFGLWRLNCWLPLKHIYLFLTGLVFFEMQSGFRVRHAAMLLLAVCDALLISPQHAWITFLLGALLWIVIRYRAPYLACRPLLFLGTISYPLHLVHQNIGYVVIRAAEQYGIESHVSILLAATATCGLACLVTFGLEQPARRWIMQRYRARVAIRAPDLATPKPCPTVT